MSVASLFNSSQIIKSISF